ncbi:GGDEF domain-containing protein [Rhodoferax saidenbachensis]|nr:GGDEF domain-containing protein [Rhodoferax saidenbachensis]
MAGPPVGKWQRLGQWLLAHMRQYDVVQGEATMESVRRLRVFALVVLVLNVVYVCLFWLGRDGSGGDLQARYRNAIGWAHFYMGLAMLLLGFLAWRLLRQSERGSYRAIVLQLLACASGMLFAIAVSVIDQMVTSGITPFAIVSLLIAVVSLMRPAMAIPVFGVNYLVFYQVADLTQKDPALLARIRGDALVVSILSLVVSTLVLRQYMGSVLLRREIVRAHQALAEKQAELAFTATHDELTGLYNRREFMRLAVIELSRASRTPGPTCLLMLDIDFFKKINDQHGHPAGDEVLQQVAQLLTKGVRAMDVVARLGGEEFIVLLPNTGRAGASAVAEKLRMTLAQAPLQLQSLALPVTASFGLSELPAGMAGTLEDLYKAADKALYVAKRQGRNRVEFDVAKFDPPSPSFRSLSAGD